MNQPDTRWKENNFIAFIFSYLTMNKHKKLWTIFSKYNRKVYNFHNFHDNAEKYEKKLSTYMKEREELFLKITFWFFIRSQMDLKGESNRVIFNAFSSVSLLTVKMIKKGRKFFLNKPSGIFDEFLFTASKQPSALLIYKSSY